MDWHALGRETVELLRQYLMLDTTNPPGNETVGARFLEDVLGREGIATETVESAPGRGNLVARLRGDGSEGGIVLHHHIDVVYADRRYWTVDPFGGEIRDGFLYGRGAIDMKSTGVLHLAGILAIKRAKVPLKRDLILLATADEEAGSRFGAQFVADRHRDWLAGAEYALSELGGIYPDAGSTAPFGSIVTSEKTGLPLRLTARSEPGHGSMPWPDTAPNRLDPRAGPAARGRASPARPARGPGILRQARLGAAGRGGAGLRRPRALAARRELPARLPGQAPARRDAADDLRGHHAQGKREAQRDPAGGGRRHRLPHAARRRPGGDRELGARRDRRRAGGGSLSNPPAKIPNSSPPDTPLYKALGQALARRAPGVVVAPDILVGFTDNWVFRNCGLHGYGFSPFILGDDEWRRVHGNDERISLTNLSEGVRCHTEMLLDVAAA